MYSSATKKLRKYPKPVSKKAKIVKPFAKKLTIVLILSGFIASISWFGSWFGFGTRNTVEALTISVNTTWNIGSSPYVFNEDVVISGGATLTIDPGVVVRFQGNQTIRIDNGILDINGTSGNEVTITHDTSTSVGAWQGIYLNGSSATATIDFAKMYYTNVAIRNYGGTLTVNDSLFENNRVGIDSYEKASLTTARNTFNKHTYYPIGLNVDIQSATLGSGADADILGSGADINGYNAIGMGYSDTTSNDCLANLCIIPQRTFAGVANIPYVIYDDYFITGTDDTLQIDAGVVIKYRNDSFRISNSALDINGTSGNEVIITSIKDDTYGGDTNNDGNATTPAIGNWDGILQTSGNSTIDFAKILYADVGIEVLTDNTSLTVNDSLFESNRVGIDINERASLTTARNTFNKHTYYPIGLNVDIQSATLGSGADADILGSGADINGYNAIGMGYSDSTSNNCLTNLCTIPQRTFAGIPNVPYVIYDDYFITGTDDILQINAGVIIKYRNDSFRISNSALDINGTSGNEVIITSIKDDTYGGDTNNDGNATTPAIGNWDGILQTSGNSTIDFAKIMYANVGVKTGSDNTSLTVNDSLFESNHVGVDVYERASLTTARNTFNKHTYYPLVLNTDVQPITLGSGADADMLGGGTDINGYNAIGIRYSDSTSNNCPANLCTIPQRTFAGISNIPYVIDNDYYISGSDDTLQIDAGVVIKGKANNVELFITSGASLDVNGTSGNEVIFTSVKDDTHGGDTNNDESATTPTPGDWGEIALQSGNSTIDFAKILYADVGVEVGFDNTSLTINDSLFESNNIGIDVYERASLTTARNTFNKHTYSPISLNADVQSIIPGSGGDVDILGEGANINGYNAIGIRYSDSDSNNCPTNLCTLPQRTFAGITNIPYVLYNDYYISGSDDTLQIDAGVVIKGLASNVELFIRSGASLDVNGTSGNEVVFTSLLDDTHRGDTNNDGTNTTPAPGNWGKIQIESTGVHTIDFLKLYYAVDGLYVKNATQVTLNDSNFRNNTYGVRLDTTTSPTFSQNNFVSNSIYGMYNETNTIINAENQYWGASDGPSDPDNDGQCTTTNGGGDNVRDNASFPINYCTFSTTEFNSAISPGYITNLVNTLDAVLQSDFITNLENSQNAQTGLIPVGILTQSSNQRLAEFTMQFNGDRDFSNVLGDSNDYDKSFFHVTGGFSNIEGYTSGDPSYALYIPKQTNQNSVRICPGADSLGTVTLDCIGGSYKYPTDSDVSIVTLSGKTFWRVTGLSSTGGLGTFVNAADFTLTPNIDTVNGQQEVNMTYIAAGEFVNGDQIIITFENGAGLALADCSITESDADNDGTPDGSIGISSNEYTFTFTGNTTTASTGGINLCVDLTAYSSQGNYSVSQNDDNGGYGATLYYVGGETVNCGGNDYVLDGDNSMVICSNIAPTLSFNIVELDDSTDLSGNACNFGTIDTSTALPNINGAVDAGECGYGLAIGTNSASGFQATIQAASGLTTGTSTMTDVANTGPWAAGVEAYGIAEIISAGTGRDDTDGTYSLNITRDGSFSSDISPIPTATADDFISHTDGVQYSLGTDALDITKVIHGLVVGAGTPAGSYSQVVTYTVTASF